MIEPETPDEAYMRLLAQPLSERIAGLEQDQAANDWPRMLSSPEVALYIEHLRELRARRRAMGRNPDDERNATGDLACPSCGDIMGECGCAAAQAEVEAFDDPGCACPCDDECGREDCECEWPF